MVPARRGRFKVVFGGAIVLQWMVDVRGVVRILRWPNNGWWRE